MSKETRQFLENIKPPEQSMGAVSAAVEGVKIGVGAFLAGLGKVWDGAKPMFDMGRTEAAAALFSGNDRGFVMYGHGSNAVDQSTVHGAANEPVKQPEPGQSQGMER